MYYKIPYMKVTTIMMMMRMMINNNNNNNNSIQFNSIIIMIIVIIIILINYLFITCWAQQPVANYRVSTNTNSNETTQGQKTYKKRKIDQLKLFAIKHELFNSRAMARRACEHGEVTNVPMPTVSRTEGQHLVPLKTFIKSKASTLRRLLSTCQKI
jgi:uncharacterized membrane protein